MNLSSDEMAHISDLIAGIESMSSTFNAIVYIGAVRVEDYDGGVLGYVLNREGNFYFSHVDDKPPVNIFKD